MSDEGNHDQITVCIICHECMGHIQMSLSEYIKIIELYVDKVGADNPVGFICLNCLEKEEPDNVVKH